MTINAELVKQQGGFGLLVKISEFGNWALSALWQDLQLEMKHFREVTRLAFVAEERYQETMAIESMPFTAAEVRFYPENELDAARAWVRATL